MNNSASTNTRGTSFYDLGLRTPRTIDRSRPPEPEKPIDRRSEWDRGVEENAKALAESCRRAQAAREAEVARRNAEQELALKRGSYLTAELQVEQAFAVYGIQPDDQKRIEDEITQRGLWASPAVAIEFAVGESMKIVAAKQEARDARIAAVRNRCDAAQWQDVVAAVDENRGNFSDEDLASGRVYEIAYEYA